MDEVLYFDSVYWTLVIVNIIPFLVSLVANEVARKGVKEGLLAILSGIAAWAEEVFADGGAFVVEDFVVTLIVVFLGSAGMFFGWQHKTIAPALERSGTSVGSPK
jgi:hypothetical protein